MATVTVHSPADGHLVADTEAHTKRDVDAAARRLREAQPAWEALAPKERAQWLGRLRDWILDNEPELTEMLRQETGKVRGDARLEVLSVVDVITYFCGRAESAMSDERRRPHGPLTMSKELHLHRRPYQLVGVITPWNFPLVLPAMDAFPALLAGAAVMLKPSEVTPVTMGRVVDAWRDAVGAPPVFEAVVGAGRTGEAVVGAVDFVQFTGSERTGRKIAVAAAERLIPCGLELGGKDPMLVLADAPVERAANAAAWGSMFNSGQVCVSVERVYVEDAVYEPFVEKLVERVSELRQGSDGAPGSEKVCDVGAMATDDQIDIVERHVNDAIERGATVLTGGKRAARDGRYFEPTVLTDVTQDMLVMREETFGPVVPVMKVSGEDEAVRLANDSEYGLSATVWCESHTRGRDVARRLEAGAVNVNDMFINLFAPVLPMGGWKASGMGERLGGDEAIRKYCRDQAVTASRMTPASELSWFPYSTVKSAIGAAAVRMASARGLRRRLPF